MANRVWEYAWEFFFPSYFSPGGARLTQSPTPPTQRPFVDGAVVVPPPRNPPVISPAFGKLDSSNYFAYTPGQSFVVPGQDRIITWWYRYLYHGESGFGTCGGSSNYSYGQAAASPLLLAVPDIMAAPDLDGWQAMSLRLGASYQGNGGTWGDKAGLTCNTNDTLVPGDATMRLERTDGTGVLDRDGNPILSVPPADSLEANLGIIRPPASWPPFRLRVTHTINTIIVTIVIVAYVRVASAADPPEPPEPGHGIPGPIGAGTPSGTPSTVTIGAALGGVLRPPC